MLSRYFTRLRSFRRSKLFVLLANLIIAEIVVYFIFLLIALSADWGRIYENLPVSRYIRFEILEFSLLGIFQLGLIILIFAKSFREEEDINEIIKSGEHSKLEFKTTFRWDINRDQVNKDLEKAVMKTVAAFLNSDGGDLLMGVNDNGNLVGLEQDFNSLPKSDTDGFENHFNNVFSIMIGPEFRRFTRLKFENINSKIVCLVSIEPSYKPVYLKSDNGEDFYIRTGNVTTPLKMSEVATYISSWWQK